MTALQIPAFLVRCCITAVCMPFVWCVVVLLTWGIKANQPITGWRKACIRPFLKFWSGICLHIGFNYWPSAKGELQAPSRRSLSADTPCSASAQMPKKSELRRRWLCLAVHREHHAVCKCASYQQRAYAGDLYLRP